ncbi:hypothetical protein J6590_087477, partial [Homalodisca vitripennis]
MSERCRKIAKRLRRLKCRKFGLRRVAEIRENLSAKGLTGIIEALSNLMEMPDRECTV